MTFHIMNSELLDFGYSPRSLKVGDTVEVKREVRACPWKDNDADKIPAGAYIIVSRKGFNGGSQEIEKKV